MIEGFFIPVKGKEFDVARSLEELFLYSNNLTGPIPKELGKLIERNLGMKVIYTRTEDVFVPLWERTQIANNAEGDIFISIHANSIAKSPQTRGFETYLLRLGKTKHAIQEVEKRYTIQIAVWRTRDKAIEDKLYLKELGYELEDCGAFEMDPLDDYPDFIIPAAKKVAKNSNSRGIIIGGSGQGEAIAANRIKGVRAVVYYDGPSEIVKLSRMHNNANIISLGARFVSPDRSIEILTLWLSEKFEGGRHEKRINKLDL